MTFCCFFFFFFFNDTATTEIYTLSLHDALPISYVGVDPGREVKWAKTNTYAESMRAFAEGTADAFIAFPPRSEEHTSELQSLAYLVCRLLLEKKKKTLDPESECVTRATSHSLSVLFSSILLYYV